MPVTTPKKKAKKSSPTQAKLSDADDLISGILGEIGGEGGAQLLGSEGLAIKIRGVISTQVPAVDAAIGRGGIPLARLTIMHGAEGSGKTTLALHCVAECQRQNGIAIYADKEYKLDPDYASNIGVDTSRLIITQPPHLEKVFSTMHDVVKKAAQHREKTGVRVPILFVLDSMNAAITKAQLEGEWTDKHMAPQARVFSELLPKIIPEISKEDIALLFISQVRSKMNIKYGDPDDIAGGKAARFYASLILKVVRIGDTKSDGEKIANNVRVECVKNQISPPFKKADCKVVYGVGFDKEDSLIWLAEKHGIVQKNGSYFKHGGENIGQGMAASALKLREDKSWYEDILKETKEKVGF